MFFNLVGIFSSVQSLNSSCLLGAYMDDALVLHPAGLTDNDLLFLLRSIFAQSLHAHNQTKNLH